MSDPTVDLDALPAPPADAEPVDEVDGAQRPPLRAAGPSGRGWWPILGCSEGAYVVRVDDDTYGHANVYGRIDAPPGRAQQEWMDAWIDEHPDAVVAYRIDPGPPPIPCPEPYEWTDFAAQVGRRPGAPARLARRAGARAQQLTVAVQGLGRHADEGWVAATVAADAYAEAWDRADAAEAENRALRKVAAGSVEACGTAVGRAVDLKADVDRLTAENERLRSDLDARPNLVADAEQTGQALDSARRRADRADAAKRALVAAVEQRDAKHRAHVARLTDAGDRVVAKLLDLAHDRKTRCAARYQERAWEAAKDGRDLTDPTTGRVLPKS